MREVRGLRDRKEMEVRGRGGRGRWWRGRVKGERR